MSILQGGGNPRSGAALRVLVADDYSTMRRILRELLASLGHAQVCEAEDGQAAWTLLQDGDVDLLITDWQMPGMTGIELLRRIRADERLRALPVLMVTGEAQRDAIMEAARAGVNGYVVKPFTAATLKDGIDRIFARGAEAA